jgi:hypothetical protein
LFWIAYPAFWPKPAAYTASHDGYIMLIVH